eukprot:1740836-Rhodomonas_salina.2
MLVSVELGGSGSLPPDAQVPTALLYLAMLTFATVRAVPGYDPYGTMLRSVELRDACGVPADSVPVRATQAPSRTAVGTASSQLSVLPPLAFSLAQ